MRTRYKPVAFYASVQRRRVQYQKMGLPIENSIHVCVLSSQLATASLANASRLSRPRRVRDSAWAEGRTAPLLAWAERLIRPRWPQLFQTTRRLVRTAMLLLGRVVS